MDPIPDARCDGGHLDCGSGLLLIIRGAMQPLRPGGILEVRSLENSVKEDLPAWCRMVGHPLLETRQDQGAHVFLIRKAGGDGLLEADLATARDFTWKVRAKGAPEMSSVVYSRNHSMEVGASASFETEDTRPSALEHLLAALAGCLVSGFQWRLSRESIPVHGMELSLQARMGGLLHFLGIENSGEVGLESLGGALYLSSPGDETRALELWAETLATSPVLGSLNPKIALSIELRRV